MTVTQQLLTIAAIVLGTMVTRFLPFIIFPAGKPTPKYIQYLGRCFPPPYSASWLSTACEAWILFQAATDFRS